MDISRRNILLMGGAAAALFGLRRMATADRTKDVPLTRAIGTNSPRYWVFVLASGGWDAILTLDPKTKKQVEPGIDVPYDANKIVAGAGVPLGPNFAALRPWAKKMAVINTVQVSAANHEYCWMQYMRMRRAVQTSMPMIFHLLGQQREGQPLGSVAVGPGTPHDYGAGYFGTRATYWGDPIKFQYTAYNADDKRFLDELGEMPAEDLAVMARGLRSEQRSLEGLGGARNLRAAQAAGESAALFEALPRYTKFEPEDWGEVDDTGDYYAAGDARRDVARDFQRALWALQNDVTKVAYVRVGALEWDSHQNNLPRQTTWNGHLAAGLAKFLERLQTTSNEHGTLASQTAIVVGSECGRFPKVNPHAGKDHLPETPYMFFGPNINTGTDGRVFGGTDRQMLGLPLDLATGRPTKGGTQVALEDIGSTLLAMNGTRPDLYGYSGRVLRFLGA